MPVIAFYIVGYLSLHFVYAFFMNSSWTGIIFLRKALHLFLADPPLFYLSKSLFLLLPSSSKFFIVAQRTNLNFSFFPLVSIFITLSRKNVQTARDPTLRRCR